MTELLSTKNLRRETSLQYLVVILIMAVLAVGAIVLVSLVRPTQDNTALIAAILSVTAPTTMALLAFMKSQETHLSVNSRLDEFMETQKENARMKGEQVGVERERVAGAAIAATVVIDRAVADAVLKKAADDRIAASTAAASEALLKSS